MWLWQRRQVQTCQNSKNSTDFYGGKAVFSFKVLFLFVKRRPVRHLTLGIYLFDKKVGKINHVRISKSQQLFLIRLIFFFKVWFFVKGRHGSRPVKYLSLSMTIFLWWNIYYKSSHMSEIKKRKRKKVRLNFFQTFVYFWKKSMVGKYVVCTCWYLKLGIAWNLSNLSNFPLT